MLSGANLSKDYFVDRQDRYVLLDDTAAADCFHAALLRLTQCQSKVSAAASTTTTSAAAAAAAVASAAMASRPPRVDTAVQAADILGPLDANSGTSAGVDTWVFPTVQCAPWGIRQDEAVLEQMLGALPEASDVLLATPYLNPWPDLARALARTSPAGQLEVLTAHLSSHGFHRAQGGMALVPGSYEAILDRCTKRLVGLRQGDWRILAYKRAHWTFHAKGIWAGPALAAHMQGSRTAPPRDQDVDVDNLPDAMLTVLGSSNYNRRYRERDLEVQVVVLTENRELIRALVAEAQSLRAWAVPLARNNRPRPKWWGRALSWALGGLM